MKKVLFLLISLFTLPCFAINKIILVNHYGSPLKFEVGQHSEIIPDLPSEFVLRNTQSTNSLVAEGSDGAEEGYIGIRPVLNPSKDAFIGVDRKQIHGYIDKGVAYSWQNTQEATIIFCTPIEYRANGGHC
jgi:hypothetical protein